MISFMIDFLKSLSRAFFQTSFFLYGKCQIFLEAGMVKSKHDLLCVITTCDTFLSAGASRASSLSPLSAVFSILPGYLKKLTEGAFPFFYDP